MTERKLFHTNINRLGDSVSLELWTTNLHHNLRLQPFLAKWHILNRVFCRIFCSLPRFRIFINSSSIDPYAQVYTSETNSSHQKIDGWKTTFLLARPIFRFHGRFFGGVRLEKNSISLLSKYSKSERFFLELWLHFVCFWDSRLQYINGSILFIYIEKDLHHLGVSLNGGTPKTPQNDHF